MKVRTQILNFLKMRESACKRKLVGDPQRKLVAIGELKKRFDFIRDMNEWRQLHEVYLQRHLILEVLPAASGKQSAIRDKILGLIERSENEAWGPRYLCESTINISNMNSCELQVRKEATDE